MGRRGIAGAPGLLIRSFVALQTVELGFKPDHVLVVDPLKAIRVD